MSGTGGRSYGVARLSGANAVGTWAGNETPTLQGDRLADVVAVVIVQIFHLTRVTDRREAGEADGLVGSVVVEFVREKGDLNISHGHTSIEGSAGKNRRVLE